MHWRHYPRRGLTRSLLRSTALSFASKKEGKKFKSARKYFEFKSEISYICAIKYSPMNEKQLKLKIRIWLALFIVGLALSGITAFPIETELGFLARHAGSFPAVIGRWITGVYNAVKNINSQYPYPAH